MTPQRRVLRARMMDLAKQFGPQTAILEIGIGGDDPPGANREWFKAETYETADKDTSLKPDHYLDLGSVEPMIGPYPLVICSQTLEHVREPRRAFACLHRLVAPGGHCIMDTPFLYPWHGPDDYWRFTPAAVQMMAEEAGFSVEEVWTDPNAMVVSAVMRRPT